MGRGGRELDRVAWPELVRLEPDRHAQPAAQHHAVLATGVTHELALAPRRGPRFIGEPEHLDGIAGGVQLFPADTGGELEALPASRAPDEALRGRRGHFAERCGASARCLRAITAGAALAVLHE